MRRVEAMIALRQPQDQVESAVTAAIVKGSDRFLERKTDKQLMAAQGMPVSVVHALDDMVVANGRYTSQYFDLWGCCAATNECLGENCCDDSLGGDQLPASAPCLAAVAIPAVLLIISGAPGVTVPRMLYLLVASLMPCFYVRKYGKTDCVCKSTNVAGICGCMLVMLVWAGAVAVCCLLYLTVGSYGIRDCDYLVEWTTQPQGSSIDKFAVTGCYVATGPGHYESRVDFPIDMIGASNALFIGVVRMFVPDIPGDVQTGSKHLAKESEDLEKMKQLTKMRQQAATQHLRWNATTLGWSFTGACARCGVTCLTRVNGQPLSDIEVPCTNTYSDTFLDKHSLVCAVPVEPAPSEWARVSGPGVSLAAGPPENNWERQRQIHPTESTDNQWESAAQSFSVQRGSFTAGVGASVRLVKQLWLPAAPYYENCGRRTWKRFFTFSGNTVVGHVDLNDTQTWAFNYPPSEERAPNGTLIKQNHGGAWQCDARVGQQRTFSTGPNAQECESESQSQWPMLNVPVSGVGGADYIGARAFFLLYFVGPWAIIFLSMLSVSCCCGNLCKTKSCLRPWLLRCTVHRTKVVSVGEIEEQYCGPKTTLAAILCVGPSCCLSCFVFSNFFGQSITDGSMLRPPDSQWCRMRSLRDRGCQRLHQASMKLQFVPMLRRLAALDPALVEEHKDDVGCYQSEEGFSWVPPTSLVEIDGCRLSWVERWAALLKLMKQIDAAIFLFFRLPSLYWVPNISEVEWQVLLLMLVYWPSLIYVLQHQWQEGWAQHGPFVLWHQLQPIATVVLHVHEKVASLGQ